MSISVSYMESASMALFNSIWQSLKSSVVGDKSQDSPEKGKEAAESNTVTETPPENRSESFSQPMKVVSRVMEENSFNTIYIECCLIFCI